MRNAVDELQRVVTERENEKHSATLGAAAAEEIEELKLAMAAAATANQKLAQEIAQLQASNDALQAGHAELEAE